jgi:HKD family nuclease
MKRVSHSFEFIENVGPNSVLGNLRRMTKGAGRVDIAVAFISASGLNQLLPSLQRVASRGEVRILTGLYQGITDPRALRTLLRVQEQTRGRLSVRISRESKFHRKLYLVRTGTTLRAVVGSSNLTSDGLSSGGELNVYLSSPATSAPMRRLSEAFEEAWERQAVPLNEEIIGRYERSGYAKPQRAAKKSMPLRSILGTRTTSCRANEEQQQSTPSFWRDHIHGYVSKQTEAVIASTTDWDQRGYYWYSSGAHPFKRKDRILIFDFTDDRVKMVEVVDSTRTAVRTPDGVHFVAFRIVRGEKSRRLTPARWKGLKEALGVTRRSDLRTRRKLSLDRWSMAREVLHATRLP